MNGFCQPVWNVIAPDATMASSMACPEGICCTPSWPGGLPLYRLCPSVAEAISILRSERWSAGTADTSGLIGVGGLVLPEAQIRSSLYRSPATMSAAGFALERIRSTSFRNSGSERSFAKPFQSLYSLTATRALACGPNSWRWILKVLLRVPPTASPPSGFRAVRLADRRAGETITSPKLPLDDPPGLSKLDDYPRLAPRDALKQSKRRSEFPSGHSSASRNWSGRHRRAPPAIHRRIGSPLENPALLSRDLRYAVGLKFWLSRNRLVGSYRFLSAASRWYFWGP